PRIIPVRDGTLVGHNPNFKSRARIVGCIPLSGFKKIDTAMDNRGEFLITERVVLKNMSPCVMQGSMLVTVAVEKNAAELKRLVQTDPEKFYSVVRGVATVRFVSQFVVLAIY